MNGWFAAGNFNEIGKALALHERIQHPFDLREGPVRCSLRGGVGKTNRAREIAFVVDLNQRKTGMLLVVRAQAAIVGTAEMRAALVLQGKVTRLDEIPAHPEITGVSGDKAFLRAVNIAPLEVKDVVALENDLAGTSRRQTSQSEVVCPKKL